METRTTRRRWMRRLLVLAIPAAALPVMMAAPASAEAGPPAACVSVWTSDPNVQTGCTANPDETPPHVVGAQVCADQDAHRDDDDTLDVNLLGTTTVARTVEGDTVWVEGEGNLVDGSGGLNVGTENTAVGVSDDVGNQCDPGA